MGFFDFFRRHDDEKHEPQQAAEQSIQSQAGQSQPLPVDGVTPQPMPPSGTPDMNAPVQPVQPPSAETGIPTLPNDDELVAPASQHPLQTPGQAQPPVGPPQNETPVQDATPVPPALSDDTLGQSGNIAPPQAEASTPPAPVDPETPDDTQTPPRP